MTTRIIFIVFLLLLSCYRGIAQDKYNLGLEREKNKIPRWYSSGNGCSLGFDKTIKKQGQNSIIVSVIKDQINIITGAVAKLDQAFLIPNVEGTGKVKIGIYSKGDPNWEVSLNAVCLDKIENILSERSIKYHPITSWKKDSFIFDINNMKILSLNIKLKLNKDFLNKNELITPVWLDQLEIEIDNTDINKFEEFDDFTELVNDIEMNKVSLTSPLITEITTINELGYPKIIALGETIHGSSTINQIAFNTMRQLIEKQNVKLIMFEMPIDLVMHWNSYVSNKSSIIQIEEFFPIGGLYDPVELKKLLDWVRNYNLCTDEKITIMGIDKAGSYHADCYLKKYFNRRMVSSVEFIDSISKNLCGFDIKKYQNAYSYLLKNWNKIDKYIPKKELLIFNQALKGISMIIYPPNELFEGTRDYVMAQNAILGIDSLLKDHEKAIIYSHFQHTSKTCSHIRGEKYPTMGSYLNEKYDNDYYNIGLFAGTGTFTANNDTMIIDNNALGEPIFGSLENKCMDMNDELFFSSLSVSHSGNNICYYRHKGNTTGINQFYVGNIVGKLDAVIFSRNSTGFPIPEQWPIYTKDWFWFIVKQYNANKKKDIQ